MMMMSVHVGSWLRDLIAVLMAVERLCLTFLQLIMCDISRLTNHYATLGLIN
jgi:hypothetical protein